MSLTLCFGVCALGPAAADEINVDLGTFGLTRLAAFIPTLAYQSFDDAGTRPGGDALGMGGAYLAQASGAQALGWNPAGLSSLERTGLAFDGYFASSRSTVDSYPDTLTVPGFQALMSTAYRIDQKSALRANFLGAGAPLYKSGGMRVVGGFSWRRYYDVTSPEEAILNLVQVGVERGFPISATNDRSERGTVQSFAPALAARLGGGFSVGANFNILNGRLRSNSLIRLSFGGAPQDVLMDASMKYRGFVPDLGARWETGGGRLMAAALYTPKYTLKVDGGGFTLDPHVQQAAVTVARYTGKIADHEYQVPAAYRFGIAFRPLSRLLLAADAQVHDWSGTKMTYTEPVNGTYDPAAASGAVSTPFRDVSTIHLGAEYVLLRKGWGDVPVRVGFHTAPMSVAQMSGDDFAADTLQTEAGPAIDYRGSGRYVGNQVKGNAYSFGVSLRTKEVNYDLGVESVRYDLNRFFLDLPYDLTFNPTHFVNKLQRTNTRMSLSASYRF